MPTKHNVTLNLIINNVIIPTVKNSKILELALHPDFNFGDHAKITKEKADSSIKIIIKALTSTSWGKQKETVLATYKTMILLVIKYARTIWSPVVSETSLQKLQTTQNNVLRRLRVITGWTCDNYIKHLHQ